MSINALVLAERLRRRQWIGSRPERSVVPHEPSGNGLDANWAGGSSQVLMSVRQVPTNDCVSAQLSIKCSTYDAIFAMTAGSLDKSHAMSRRLEMTNITALVCAGAHAVTFGDSGICGHRKATKENVDRVHRSGGHHGGAPVTVASPTRRWRFGSAPHGCAARTPFLKHRGKSPTPMPRKWSAPRGRRREVGPRIRI